VAYTRRKFKIWSEVLFWFLNPKYLKLITTFAWAWNHLSHGHIVWTMHSHIFYCWWLKSYRDHCCYELAASCWFLSVNCLFPAINSLSCFCNWWIQLLMHLVFLLYNSSYVVTSSNTQVIFTLFVCFVFIYLFQVDKSSCRLTNSCNCWAFIFQLWFC
jgi:hypothetical protein